MYNSIKTVESVVNEAIAIVVSAGGEYGALTAVLTQYPDISNGAKWFRKAVFPKYQTALNHIRDCFVDDNLQAACNTRLQTWAQHTITACRADINNVSKVSVVINPEIEALKAELAAFKASDNAKAELIKNLERDNRNLTQKLGAYQTLVEGLKSRTIVIGKIITKVFVENKVENKSNFR